MNGILKIVFVFIFLIMTTNLALAQKISGTVQQIWFSYNNLIRLSDKWGLWNDAQLRTQQKFFNGFSVAIVRTGLTYFINDDLRVTAGYAYAHYFPTNTDSGNFRPEHRPWQQILWQQKFASFRFTQGIRLEERFLKKIENNIHKTNGYDFNYRLRYSLAFNFAFTKNAFAPKTFSYIISDEVHLNYGKQVVYNSFDQNRVFVATQYHINEQNFFQLGYLYIYQQTSGGNYRYRHAARITYQHGFNLRRNKGKNDHAHFGLGKGKAKNLM